MKAAATIWYDIPRTMSERSPARGDYIRSISRRNNATLSVYMITGVREVRRRKPNECRRFSLQVQRGYTLADISSGVQCWMLHWYSRKKVRK